SPGARLHGAPREAGPEDHRPCRPPAAHGEEAELLEEVPERRPEASWFHPQRGQPGPQPNHRTGLSRPPGPRAPELPGAGTLASNEPAAPELWAGGGQAETARSRGEVRC